MAETTRATPAQPSFLYAAFRVFDLSLSTMLWSRRTIFMALLLGLPVVAAVIIRVAAELGAIPPGANRSGPFIFGMMIWLLYVRFSIPVLGVFYGTALIADEVEDKTITYLFTRPVPRAAILLGKYFAFLACTVFVVLPSVILVWLLIVPINGSLGDAFPDLLKDLMVMGLGLMSYGAVFALAGAALKRPLLTGLFFVFGWELITMLLPGFLKRVTVAYYLQGLVPHAMPQNSSVSLIQDLFREIPSLTTCLVGLAVITVLCLWLAGRAVTRREYVLEQ